jgi:hypothetical protein
MKNVIVLFALVATMTSCGDKNHECDHKEKCHHSGSILTGDHIKAALDSIKAAFPAADMQRAEKGVKQAAALWFAEDGTAEDFIVFCKENFIADETMREATFRQISTHLETLFGLGNKMMVNLLLPIHVSGPEPLPADMMFGSFNPSSHLTEDMFSNKIAFYVLLNFPVYTLSEKMAAETSWSRKDWAYARLADMFTARIPGDLNRKFNEISTRADNYIANYNIYLGNLVDKDKKTFFASDIVRITHWGLRDEIKSNYAGEGLEKQKMIYEVMKHIIYQTIPENVINNGEYQWNPYNNTLYKEGGEVKFKPEPDTRYLQMLNLFRALKEIDPYSPNYPDYISRKFDGDMEMSQKDVEKLFVEYISSPVVKEVAVLISQRLGRPLEPFDIWYDGFKARSSVNEEDLNAKTRKLYPTPAAFQAALPGLLVKMGWTKERAAEICSKITVDPSRGAGHAWGSEMRGDNARLRTRIAENGMDYKGYNIAVHEFGHNVEQTISLYNMDYYLLHGVPNTSFTEALAFAFQKRDLELLDIKNNDVMAEHMEALDNFWATYEIMGVSLVDMKVWQWMYANPNANETQLKEAVIKIAKEVWNSYYAPVFGKNDEPILAIYSHMIDNPLYLSAYPIGHVIEFQLAGHLKGKNFPEEVERIYKLGRLCPQVWMKQAVGSEVSTTPMAEAAKKALEAINKK